MNIESSVLFESNKISCVEAIIVFELEKFYGKLFKYERDEVYCQYSLEGYLNFDDKICKKTFALEYCNGYPILDDHKKIISDNIRLIPGYLYLLKCRVLGLSQLFQSRREKIDIAIIDINFLRNNNFALKKAFKIEFEKELKEKKFDPDDPFS